ncbi:MAG: restriction endonuclease subunit S [Endomicrobium sp.]|nr:restriction endonuclease subunit S [Endomicrobium sp.]
MKNWKNYNLGDISKNIMYGYTASASKQNIGPKFLRITDISSDIIDWNSVPFCLISDTDLIKYSLEQNDIVIARTGASTGATYRFTERDPPQTVFASYLIRLRINMNIANPIYVAYLLKSSMWTNFVENIIGGSAQPGANAKNFAEFNFWLPPLPEQKAIASVLSSLDDKIDLLHRQNKTLEGIAEALFKQLFVVEAKNDWEVTSLGELFSISIGRTPPRNEKKYFTLNKFDNIWVSIKDMGKNGLYIFESSEYLTSEAINKFKIPIINEDTVILSFKMTVGRVSITANKMYTNEAIAAFNGNFNSIIPNIYLYFFLKLYKYDELGTTSTIVTSINSAMIKEIQLAIPSKILLDYFNTICLPLFNKIKYNQKKIFQLEYMRDILITKLLNGEISVLF